MRIINSYILISFMNASMVLIIHYFDIKTFKASLYSSEKHFIFNNVLLMNRRLALKVFIIDKETSGEWIIKNFSRVCLANLHCCFVKNLFCFAPILISILLSFLITCQAGWFAGFDQKPKLHFQLVRSTTNFP